jgi:hypothetical protein
MALDVTTQKIIDVQLASGTTGDLQTEVNAIVAKPAIGTDSIVKSITQTAEGHFIIIVQKPDNP